MKLLVRGLAALILAATALSCTSAAEREEQAELLGLFVDPDDPAAVLEFVNRDTVRVQELIVECMARAGFDYEPVLPAKDPREGGSLSADEYRELYGWGMMSSWEETLTDEPGDIDPNTTILAGMDEAARVAWELTLYGDPDTWHDPDRGEGCEAEAERQVNAFRDTEAWAELQPLLEEVPYRAMADPRWIEADRDWSRCMAEVGYDVPNVDEAIELVSERFFDAWEVATPPPGEPAPELRWDPKPWFVETDVWQELVQFELDLAAADDACTQDHDLIHEYQVAFLEENQDLILQLQAELSE